MAFDWINKRENGRKQQTLLSNALESISTQMILCLYRQPHLSSALLHHNLLMLTYGRVLYVLTVNYATVLYLQLTDSEDANRTDKINGMANPSVCWLRYDKKLKQMFYDVCIKAKFAN